MKTKPTLWLVPAAVLITAAVFGLLRNLPNHSSSPVTTSELVVVAEKVLAEKLSGPRYFNAAPTNIQEDDGPWIEASEAWRQLARVAAERKMSPEEIQKARQLIEQTTEEPPSRMVGGERINLSRLNLSLDSLKEP